MIEKKDTYVGELLFTREQNTDIINRDKPENIVINCT